MLTRHQKELNVKTESQSSKTESRSSKTESELSKTKTTSTSSKLEATSSKKEKTSKRRKDKHTNSPVEEDDKYSFWTQLDETEIQDRIDKAVRQITKGQDENPALDLPTFSESTSTREVASSDKRDALVSVEPLDEQETWTLQCSIRKIDFKGPKSIVKCDGQVFGSKKECIQYLESIIRKLQ